MANVDSKNRYSQPFIPDSPIIFNLPLGDKIRKGNVILTGSITVTGVTAAGVAFGEGGPTNLIKRIKVTATPSPGSRYPGGKIVDATPRSLQRYAIFQRGKYVAEQSGSVLGNGANGVYPIYLSIPIYWADSTLRNGIATALNTDGPGASTPGGTYTSIQVEVDTGDLTTCFTGNNGVVNWAGLQVQWQDDRIQLAGDTLVRYQEDHRALIAATFSRFLDPAMPQDGLFESWLIIQEQGAQAALSNSLLNRVTIASPTLLYDKYTDDILQDMLDSDWIDASQSSTGLSFIDFTDGMLANRLPAGTLQLQLDVNNVSGANLDDLLIFTRRTFSPLPAQK